jgi:hypothetical protein
LWAHLEESICSGTYREHAFSASAARIRAISIAYLSRIERERENPPPDRLMTALARALDLPVDDVFAVARRLPPDLRARTNDVIAVYRRQSAGRAP